MWKTLIIKPEDDRNYLVSYRRTDGSFAAPHRAFYSEEENKFISLENPNAHPIVADIYTEIPELPGNWVTS